MPQQPGFSSRRVWCVQAGSPVAARPGSVHEASPVFRLAGASVFMAEPRRGAAWRAKNTLGCVHLLKAVLKGCVQVCSISCFKARQDRVLAMNTW